MGPLPPTQDDRAIWDIWQSQYTLPAVTCADELGVTPARLVAARERLEA